MVKSCPLDSQKKIRWMHSRMMYMALSILALILLTSKSCNSDADFDPEARSVAEQEYTLKSIRSEFETAYISDERLVLFNETAKQKMHDLADYLSLYASTHTDSLFKQQIKDVIFRLFNDSSAMVQFFPPHDESKNSTNNDLKTFLEDLDRLPYQSIMIDPSDLKVLESLHYETEGRYSGMLGCKMHISGITDHDTTSLYQGQKEIEIIAVLTEKQFGKENNLKVWQVFLHQIHDQGAAI